MLGSTHSSATAIVTTAAESWTTRKANENIQMALALAAVTVLHRLNANVLFAQRVRMPDAAPNEAKHVEQPRTIVTHRRVEEKTKAIRHVPNFADVRC